MSVTTKVTQYLDSKKIDYFINGDQANFSCPFCNASEKTCFMNVNNFLWDCKRAKCTGPGAGNEFTFKQHFGDAVRR